MRLIPDWFSEMILGMAVLYLPFTLVTFYAYGSEPFITTGAGFTVDVWLSGGLIAVIGGISYSLGALAFGWLLRGMKYLYRRIVQLAQ